VDECIYNNLQSDEIDGDYNKNNVLIVDCCRRCCKSLLSTVASQDLVSGGEQVWRHWKDRK